MTGFKLKAATELQLSIRIQMVRSHNLNWGKHHASMATQYTESKVSTSHYMTKNVV